MLQLAGGSHVGTEPSQLEMLMTYGSHMHPQNLPWSTIFGGSQAEHEHDILDSKNTSVGRHGIKMDQVDAVPDDLLRPEPFLIFEATIDARKFQQYLQQRPGAQLMKTEKLSATP